MNAEHREHMHRTPGPGLGSKSSFLGKVSRATSERQLRIRQLRLCIAFSLVDTATAKCPTPLQESKKEAYKNEALTQAMFSELLSPKQRALP